MELPAIFDLAGPQFLVFYAGLLAASLVLAWIVRAFLRGPFDYDHLAASRLEPYDIAYLQGGAPRSFHSVLTGLLEKGIVRINGDAISVVYGEYSRHYLAEHVLEREVVRQVDGQKVSRLNELFRACDSAFNEVRAKLERAQMLVSKSADNMMITITVIIYTIVVAIGSVKIWIGVSRERPVVFLCGLVMLTMIIAIFHVSHRRILTGRGKATLKRLRKEKQALRTSAAAGSRTLAGNDLALGVALFGLAAMPALYPDLTDWSRRNKPEEGGGNASSCGGGSSSCSSSGGGDSGGGGGSGCGGCGGGGCGGGGGD